MCATAASSELAAARWRRRRDRLGTATPPLRRSSLATWGERATANVFYAGGMATGKSWRYRVIETIVNRSAEVTLHIRVVGARNSDGESVLWS